MNYSRDTFTEKQSRRIVCALLFLMPIIGMAVDLISPSLPAISAGLNISAAIAKNVISIYMLGYALGNFITGFLADALGRQKLLRISLFAFFVISLLPVFFSNIQTLLLTRLLQGITLGAVAVLVRTIFSDILSTEKLVRLGILIGTMWGLGPILGPVIGGYLQSYFGWHAGFILFSAIAFISLIAILIIVPETHFNRHRFNINTIKNNITEVMKHRAFMGMVILTGCVYSLVLVFNTMGPFLIQETLQNSPVFFGHLALWFGVVYVSSTLICRQLLKYYTVELLCRNGIGIFFSIAVFMLASSYLFEKNLIQIILATVCMYFACGFIFPMLVARGITFFRHISGTASAVMYLINICITSLASFLCGFIHTQNSIPLMWVNVVLLFVCFIVGRMIT